MAKVNVYELRQKGRHLCKTDGSAHYKGEGIEEPLERTLRRGHGEGFCLGNVDKYTLRFDETKNIMDLVKAVDYLTILIGYLGGTERVMQTGLTTQVEGKEKTNEELTLTEEVK